MLIALIGESCTGKSTIAEALAARTGAEVFSGKDYLRLAKGEQEAKRVFGEKLRACAAGEGKCVYVITEKEHIALLPEGALRVVVTAELETIQTRFAQRMNGKLPPPLAAMLEKKHGLFDDEPCALRIRGDVGTLEERVAKILSDCVNG